MYLQGKYIYDLTADDFENLIANSIRENKSLDYKREFNIEESKGKDTDKIPRLEFLCDITSFYNSEGGCIIYGIEERKDKGKNTGVPEKLYNIEVDNQDKLEQRIISIISANTDPNITNIAIRFITVKNCLLLIIGIPKGLGLPAMVTYKDINKFFKRNNTGKYSPLTTEINQMFMLSQSVKERAEKFKSDRINKHENGKLYGPTSFGFGRIYVHIMPYSFVEDKILDLTIISNLSKDIIFPAYKNRDSERGYYSYNIDGLIATQLNSKNKFIEAYNQYFRNGVIEINFSPKGETHHPTEKYIKGYKLIKDILVSISNAILVLKKIKIEPPLIVYISMTDLSSYALVDDCPGLGTFSSEEIYLPPILLPNLDEIIINFFPIIKPYFDIIYQTAGAEKCLDFEYVMKKNGISL